MRSCKNHCPATAGREFCVDGGNLAPFGALVVMVLIWGCKVYPFHHMSRFKAALSQVFSVITITASARYQNPQDHNRKTTQNEKPQALQSRSPQSKPKQDSQSKTPTRPPPLQAGDEREGANTLRVIKTKPGAAIPFLVFKGHALQG